MLRFEFYMRISIIQDAFSAAELLLNSPCCDAQLGADYSAVCFRQLNRKQTIFHKYHGPAQDALSGDLGADAKTMPVCNWIQVYAKQGIMYLGRHTRN